jgi:1,4-alpha-glucan branching enzyme
MITKMPGPGGKVRVTFAMPGALWADSIHVVGDFNGWDERATPLRQTERGWMITLELDAGRAYQYRYLLNGREWQNDWHADGYAANQFGGDNSVLIAPDFGAEPLDASPGSQDEAKPQRVIPFTTPRLRLVPTG